MFYWLMLGIAIAAEVAGTGSIKYAGKNAGTLAYIFLFLMVGASYFFLAKAIQGIPMSVAYAVWEGLGMLLMLFLGYTFFGETLRREKLWACGAVLTGICLLHAGQRQGPPTKE